MSVCVSSGGCIKLGLGPAKAVSYLEKFAGKIDGVELCFATEQEILSFELNSNQKLFLESLSCNSIHLPFIGFSYGQDLKTKRVLDKAFKIGEAINAYAAVVHPVNVENYNFIESFNFPVSFENLNKKPVNKGFQTPKDFRKLFGEHSGVGFTLDLAHALDNGIAPDKFMEFEKRLVSIHVNGLWQSNGRKVEGGFWIESTKDQWLQSKKVLGSKKPLVIEAHFFPSKEHLIEKEIDFLKNFQLNH